MDRGAWGGYSPWGRKESDTNERLQLSSVLPWYHPASSPSYSSNQTLLPHGKKPVCLVLQQLTQVYPGNYFHLLSREALRVSRLFFQ